MSSKILTFTLNGETIRVVVEPTDMLAEMPLPPASFLL